MRDITEKIDYRVNSFISNIVPKLLPLLSQLHEVSLSSCLWESVAAASDMFSSCTCLEMQEISIDHLDIYLAETSRN